MVLFLAWLVFEVVDFVLMAAAVYDVSSFDSTATVVSMSLFTTSTRMELSVSSKLASSSFVMYVLLFSDSFEFEPIVDLDVVPVDVDTEVL